jgi:hypothetical protein
MGIATHTYISIEYKQSHLLFKRLLPHTSFNMFKITDLIDDLDQAVPVSKAELGMADHSPSWFPGHGRLTGSSGR